MKSLRDFIKESIESSKTNTKFFNLNLTKFKDSTDKVISAAEKDGLFAEKTDSGCKVKISNTSKVSSIVSALSTIIDDNKSNEELSSSIESLSNKLQEIIDFTTVKEDDGDSDNNKDTEEE